MKRAAFAALLFSCPLAPYAADARGMYCTRHRDECNRRHEAARAAAAAAAAEHDRWYAALSPINKAKEDGRIEGQEAANKDWQATWSAEDQRRDAVEVSLRSQITSYEHWVPLYVLIGAVAMALAVGFVAAIVSDSKRL